MKAKLEFNLPQEQTASLVKAKKAVFWQHTYYNCNLEIELIKKV